ncbi:U4/U6.U5 tri-snRNP-associated protein 1 [Trametes pubescens]|uniref:U4/U6.U5 tri-snRNP-associated protein 1 n=1 Tax=Trametes pubescens TaxID=154538 RepID=A0A1M2VVB3_TRAPU|nr:U4/U6.U5 tri-snRNP-associated protein 1 [Trametes pubescens]
MSMEESISLEETNKIRISLGLKPLTDDSTPANDKEKEAEDNYAKKREAEVKAKESKAVQDRLAKVRNRRELNAKLKGSTLGDVDADVDDTLKWIKKSKKREKELAKKRQEELEDMDKQFQDEYGEKDLAGLKVSHDFDGLEEGEARILTLKDSRVLDNEEDELQNVEMAEQEKEEKNKELKIKRRDYTGYDDEEFAPGQAGMKRAVLAKYDEFLEGSKESDFRLGSSSAVMREKKDKRDEPTSMSVNKTMLSIDYAKNIESADYLQPGDVGFKKPKTKKKRSTRRAVVEESDIAPANGEDQMQVDEKPIVPRQRNLDANFVDDDELQAALARSRRAKLQRPKKLSPEEIAAKIAAERESSLAKEVIDVDDLQEDEGGLTIDDTSEFVRAITYDPTPVKREPAEASLKRAVSQEPSRQASAGPSKAEVVDDPMEEIEAGEVVVKEEEDEEAILNAIENAIRETEAAERVAQESGEPVGTASEQTFGAGMAATLTILRQQGVLAQPNADLRERERTQLQRDVWLAEYRRIQAQRELERTAKRGGNKDQATREYENRVREQQEARQMLEAFRDYKPDVNIVYHDEFGRELTPKEAWKALSHKFHGKGSGKAKTEKRLKKIAEERKKEAMASGDTPLSMNQAFQKRQEKTGQAHFVLSVGNRGAVPQFGDFLDSQPLTKGKTEKKKEKKKSDKGATPQLDSTGFMTLPAPVLNNGSPAGSTSNGSPAPRPGFSRIASVVESDTPKESTPVPSERLRVAFGLGTKRKAAGEATDSPPPKRR